MHDYAHVYEFQSLVTHPFSDLLCVCPSTCLSDYSCDYSPVPLRSIVLGPYHHLDSFEGLPVVGWVVLCRHVVPCSPEDPIPDPLVPLVVVLPIQVGRHAGIEPPTGAVVGTAVSGGVHVVVAVGRGEKLLVVVEVLVEADGVTGSPTVSTDRQPVAQEFIGHVKLVVLCILPNALKVLQLDAQDHVFGFCQQVDMVIAQPELTSEVPEAFLVLSPGAVEADRPVKPLLYHSPSTSKGLHVTKDLKCPIARIRGDAIHTVLPHLQDVVVRTVPRG